MGVFPTIATIVVPGFPYDWHCEEVVQPLWVRDYPDDLRTTKSFKDGPGMVVRINQTAPGKKGNPCLPWSCLDTAGNPVAQAAARAIGQSASIIHSAQHYIGLAFMGHWQSLMINSGRRQAGNRLNNTPPKSVVVSKPLCV